MAGLGVAIYTDEMIDPALAIQLRVRGYDAVSCREVGRANRSISDPEQLAWATGEGRAILTQNVQDYLPLDRQWKREGREHAGIILYSGDLSVGELLRRVMTHLEMYMPETQHNIALWV